jgi:acetoin utilization protein AcuB
MHNGEMHVGEAMRTELVTLAPEDRLDVASDIMTLGRIRHMPVVSDAAVVGILTQRDLFRAAISSVLELRPAAEREWLSKIHVGEVMTHPVVTARPDLTMHAAVTLMLERRIGCLPVVQSGRLVGLLSETDCLALLARLLQPDGAGMDARRDAP